MTVHIDESSEMHPILFHGPHILDRYQLTQHPDDFPGMTGHFLCKNLSPERCFKQVKICVFNGKPQQFHFIVNILNEILRQCRQLKSLLRRIEKNVPAGIRILFTQQKMCLPEKLGFGFPRKTKSPDTDQDDQLLKCDARPYNKIFQPFVFAICFTFVAEVLSCGIFKVRNVNEPDKNIRSFDTGFCIRSCSHKADEASRPDFWPH